MVIEIAAANRLLGDINRAIAQGLGERAILVDRTPAIVIEWEGPRRRWQIREGFRPVLGETITLPGTFLLLFHPRERIERILGQIDPLLDPKQKAAVIADRLNRTIQAGLKVRSVTIESVPAFIATYSSTDNQWLPFPVSLQIGEEVGITEREVIIFASVDVTRQVAQRLVAPPPTQVNIPGSVRQALHALQQREDSIEYGGGIDFELMRGRAEVERLLVFLGGFREVPGSIRQQFTDDVELEFHTHPDRIQANPSLQDLIAFSAARQKAALIVARDDMLLFFKQPGFIPFKTERQICDLVGQAGLQRFGFAIDEPLISVRMERIRANDDFMREFLGLDIERIPRSEPGPINIPLEIVQVPSR